MSLADRGRLDAINKRILALKESTRSWIMMFEAKKGKGMDDVADRLARLDPKSQQEVVRALVVQVRV
ncbi:MAG: hypothetical protein HY291_16760 [Planctomycetes bacterium]|nr:hypothetical protein [Planctomycetota bacterium]